MAGDRPGGRYRALRRSPAPGPRRLQRPRHARRRASAPSLIPTRGAPDSRGDSQITCKMIQGGKRRVVCHGPGDCGADGLYGRRGSPICEAGKGCCAGAPAAGDRGGARRRLAGRSSQDRRHGSSDAAGLGDPVQRARAGRSDQHSLSGRAPQARASSTGLFSPGSWRRVRSRRCTAWCAGGPAI